MATAQERILHLRKEITKHDELYDQNRPIIADGEYDSLYSELVELEEKHPSFFDPDSPTQRIITSMVKELKTVRHETLMLSQKKAHSMFDIRMFFPIGSGKRLLAQYKLDGLTVVLYYFDGKLMKAVTRGTGEQGEDITHSVKTIKNVPTSIPYKGEIQVRMEAIMPYAEFERVNLESGGKYSNPRNLASGTLRQLDASVAKGRNLQGIVFDCVKFEGMNFENDMERLKFLEGLGFTIVETKSFELNESGLESLEGFVGNIGENVRKTLPYMIDGLIIKYDDLDIRENLGSTSKHPLWSIAYKYKSLEATTKLLEVTNQVGKTGQITPVAELETVLIDNVQVSRATLHNFNFTEKMDIRIGDTVVAVRANDVIPKITSSLKELRTGEEKVISIPEICPDCGSKTEKIKAILYCTGIDCAPQLKGKIEHFGSKRALDVDGLGEKTVETFFEQGIIRNFMDLYRLENHRSAICELQGYGEKTLNKLMDGLEKAKTAPLHKVLFALSIRNIGENGSKILSREFASMNEMLEASLDPISFKQQLLLLGDFGETTSQSVVDFFAGENNRTLIESLISEGFTMVSSLKKNEDEAVINEGSKVAGKTFVITGKLSKSRDEFKSIIETKGGKTSGSVSAKTDYVILGSDKLGSKKHKDALAKGIQILSEEEFIELSK